MHTVNRAADLTSTDQVCQAENLANFYKRILDTDSCNHGNITMI